MATKPTNQLNMEEIKPRILWSAVLLLLVFPSLGQAQAWEKVSMDKKVTLLMPGPVNRTELKTKLTLTATYSLADILIDRNSIPDSMALTYGSADSFDFYYRGFVQNLKEVTHWEIRDEKERQVGPARIRTFVTPANSGLIQWGLFMIDRDSYLIRFADKGNVNTAADRQKFFDSIGITP